MAAPFQEVAVIEFGIVGAALALLFLWLVGHWFARVLVFLLTWVPLSLCFLQGYRDRSDAMWPIAISAVAIWGIASVPTWLRAVDARQSQATGSLRLRFP